MIWLLLGLTIAASPPVIELEDGRGDFLLVNPNNVSVDFRISGDVIPEQGKLTSFEEQHIFVKGDENITIIFSAEDQNDVQVHPALFLPVISEVTFSSFWALGIMGFGCLLVCLLLIVLKMR